MYYTPYNIGMDQRVMCGRCSRVFSEHSTQWPHFRGQHGSDCEAFVPADEATRVKMTVWDAERARGGADLTPARNERELRALSAVLGPTPDGTVGLDRTFMLLGLLDQAREENERLKSRAVVAEAERRTANEVAEWLDREYGFGQVAASYVVALLRNGNWRRLWEAQNQQGTMRGEVREGRDGTGGRLTITAGDRDAKPESGS